MKMEMELNPQEERLAKEHYQVLKFSKYIYTTLSEISHLHVDVISYTYDSYASMDYEFRSNLSNILHNNAKCIINMYRFASDIETLCYFQEWHSIMCCLNPFLYNMNKLCSNLEDEIFDSSDISNRMCKYVRSAVAEIAKFRDQVINNLKYEVTSKDRDIPLGEYCEKV